MRRLITSVRGASIPLEDSGPLMVGLIGAAGLGVVVATQGNARLATEIPFALVVGALLARRPAGTITFLFLLAGAYGTFAAFVPVFPALQVADLLLAALWIGVGYSYLYGVRTRPVHFLPGLILVMVYIAVTVAGVVGSSDFTIARAAFRLTAWHMLALVLIAVAPWEPRVFQRIVKGAVVMTILVAGYCSLRYGIGSAAKETAVARATHPELPVAVPLRFFGSFPSAQELSAWCASVLPFMLALMLTWRGRWRALAAVAFGFGLVALFAADTRTGIAACIVGFAVTVIAFLGSRAFSPGWRIGAGFVVVLTTVALGVSGYMLTVAGNPTKEHRLTAVFSPSHDQNFQNRQDNWRLAWQVTFEKPFGHGLGTTGSTATSHGRTPVGPVILDSSYLEVGIEQGPIVMALFAFTLLALLANLLLRTLQTIDKGRAALAIGATGTLASMIVLMYGSTYFQAPPMMVAWILIGLGVAQFTTGGVGSGWGARDDSARAGF